MEGSGWAGVQTWVRAAEAGTNDLQVVSAADARPGDIVCYDWGGQEDFGSDGHIGFLASNVEGDKFTALEGNNQDAVMSVPRSTSQANVKFLRIGGTGSAPPAAPGVAAPPVGAPAPPAAVEIRRRRVRDARPARRGRALRRRRRGRRRGRGRRRERRQPLSGRRRPQGADRRLDVQGSREARPPATAADHGLTRRVRHDQHPRRRRRLRRLLPDARRHLEPGRLRRLPPTSPSCRSNGSSTRPNRSRRPASPPASRSTTPTPSANGSPTSNAPPSNTAAATNSSSTKPTASSAAPPPPHPPQPQPPSTRPRPARPPRRPTPPTPPSTTAATRCSSWPPRARRRRRRRTSTARPCSS